MFLIFMGSSSNELMYLKFKNRCFCRFPVAICDPQRDINISSPYKAILYIIFFHFPDSGLNLFIGLHFYYR